MEIISNNNSEKVQTPNFSRQPSHVVGLDNRGLSVHRRDSFRDHQDQEMTEDPPIELTIPVHDFQTQLRSSLTVTPLTRQVSTDSSSSLYSNIFGGSNAYETVISQLEMNVKLTKNHQTHQVQPQRSISSSESSTHPLQAQKNHSQEEKDDELLRNISNYGNLLEQQLFIENSELMEGQTVSALINLSHQDFTHHSAQESVSNPQFIQCQPIRKKNNQKSLLASKVLNY